MDSHDPDSLESRLKAAEKRVGELELEVHALHTRLHQITTSKAWAFLDFFRRARYWLLYAPTDRRREKARQVAEGVLRKTRLYGPAAWTWRTLRRAGRTIGVGATGSQVAAPAGIAGFSGDDVGLSCGYDVLCLPVILWNSRFQRPQQLMRRFAARGHRVFYASLGFHRGKNAKLAPLEPNVCEMTLPGTPGWNAYKQPPTDDDDRRMVEAVERLRAERRIAAAVVVVQLPFWTTLAERLRERFGWPVVYDCMDDHSGFSTNDATMLQLEERTVAESDLVVVTADVLHEKVRPHARRTSVVRNACDYEHFAGEATEDGAADIAAAASEHSSRAQNPRLPLTIGFYGAIAEWFDGNLVADLAELRPGWKLELIGSTFTGDVARLEQLPNVRFHGEKPYAELPRLTADWDVFIIPFRRIPLTEATNPVKAYEMLATGKPVVAVPLPELRPLGEAGLIVLADDATGFATAIEQATADDGEPSRQRRRAFASQNTWDDRIETFDRSVRELFPRASIVIVTYNNLVLNQGCLESIFRETDWPNYEVIVVDNASNDGTAAWLSEWSAVEPRLRVILNAENRGFSAANNQGLRAATGEFLCLLNNDTVATRGWLSTLIGHLRRTAEAGMVGPTTNMAGNEAKVPVDYANIADMPRWAAEFCRRHDGECAPMMMLGFFCVLMRREVYEKVGELDEQFGVGYFEDTDYCYRVRREGYKLFCARDAFVHHWQGASFRLLGKGAFGDIYRGNQKKFERKWGAESMAGAY